MEKDDVIIFNNVEPHGWNLIGDDMKLLVMILFAGIYCREDQRI